MCDSATAQLVEQTTLSKVQSGEMFTAHDVTRAVRQQTSKRIDHNDVRAEVHGLYVNGRLSGYSRSLGAVPNVNVQPFIYHPQTADPSQYGAAAAALLPSIASVADPNDGNDGSDDGVNQTPDGTHKVDARSTLCLPRKLLAALGLTPGGTANVLADFAGQRVVVANPAATLPANYQLLSQYTVDYHGNVRVTQHTLQKGGHPGTRYKVEGDANEISIEAVV